MSHESQRVTEGERSADLMLQEHPLEMAPLRLKRTAFYLARVRPDGFH